MTILQLLTPLARIPCLVVGDTVHDAFDHLEAHDASAAPIVDANGRYVGTVTEADLRRHVAAAGDRSAAFATPLANLERRAHNPAVTTDRGLAALASRAAHHGFVPVVDSTGRLLGIVPRRRILELRLPSAA